MEHNCLEHTIDIRNSQLAQSEKLFRALFEQSAVGVAQTSIHSGRFIAVNKKFCDILGYSPDEMLELDVLTITHPDDLQATLDSRARLISGSISEFTMDKRYIHRNGQTVWANVSVSPIVNEDGDPDFHVVVVKDITERKQKENELQDKNGELERFTYTVSHDLKSPLITIQFFTGQIMQDLEAGNHDNLQGDLNKIADAAAKMTNLLDDLLELSRIGRMMNPSTQIDMGQLVKKIVGQLAGSIENRQVELVVQPDLPAVHGDPQRISEVVQNLLENAIKYMGDQANPRIEIGVRQSGKEQTFFVSDNGIGIDQRYHENIFGLFSKLDAKSHGTGIGLALVKRIIEMHGGRVWVESEGVGQGSTFCFTLGGVS